ncbi:MAG: hydrogenase 3 maturation endopeptidase HyCI [Armatimonadetes bacterium]|nr:hydrogenase 3 maturation endopeptidase HyCI [Armatimonadota bacterium]
MCAEGPIQVVLAGIGNPLRGDDEAGSLLARRLARMPGVRVVDCEEVPENYLDQLRSGPPRVVILCDAVDFGAPPGSWRWFSPEELSGTGVSTHRVSLRLLASCLRQAGVGSVRVLGIQPRRTDPGAAMAPEVERAVCELQHQLKAVLSRGAEATEAFISEGLARGDARESEPA